MTSGIFHERVSGEANPLDGKVGGEDWDGEHVGIPRKLGRHYTQFADDLTLRVSTDTYEGGIGPSVNGTSAAVSDAGNAGTNTTRYIGILQMTVGTTATGRAGLTTNTEVLFGGGKARCGSVVQIRVLSDGTNTYTARVGWLRFGTGDGTDGVFFRYTNGVNGGKWQAVTRSNNSETTADTGVTATANTTVGSDFHTFEIEVNAAGTSAEFFIDGVSVATISATIPTGSGRQTQMTPSSLVGSAGSSQTGRMLFCDAYWYEYEFDTPR